MITTRRLTLTLPLVLALLAGCGKTSAPVSPNGLGVSGVEQSALSSEMANNPTLVDDGMSESSDAPPPGTFSTSGAGTLTAIQPAAWWRTINHVDRTFDFAFSDNDSAGLPTTAVVTINKRIAGTFNILVRDPNGDGGLGTGHVIQKPLVDHWVRKVMFKRVMRPDQDGDTRGWRIVAVTGVKVTAKDATRQIESIRIQTGGLDTTVTEPLAFFRLRNILKIDPSVDVTLTVTTLNPDDVVALYTRERRMRLTANGDNTYTGTFQSPMLAGVRHLGVDAIAHSTIFDDTAPYDSQAWILPYLVRPTDLADATAR
jgi:hypothetical protein